MKILILLIFLSSYLFSKDVLIRIKKQHPTSAIQVIKMNKNKLKFLSAEQEQSLNKLGEYYLINEEELTKLSDEYEIIPNPKYRVEQVDAPKDKLFKSQWEMKVTNAQNAWKYSTGEGIIIGLIDTGIDYEHEDLVNSLWVNELEDINGNGRFDDWGIDEVKNGISGDLDGIDQDGNGFVDDVIGYDMVDETFANFGDWTEPDPIIYDEGGHGSSVAGILVGSANDIGIRGLAYNSKVLVVRAFDGAGEGEADDIAAGIVYAVMNGAKVLNFSFGEPYSSPILRDAIKFAYSMGVVMVSSSGNNGWNKPHFPSDLPEVISVGGTDSENDIYGFSNYGSFIDIVAPGNYVLSTEFGNKYGKSSGTSMSAPFVAASSALLLSNNKDLTPSQVRSILQVSAFDLGNSGWDTYFGAGLVNPAMALSLSENTDIGIDFPDFDDYFNKSNTPNFKVKGSTLLPLFDKWELYLAKGYYPDEITEEDEIEIAKILGKNINDVLFMSDETKLSYKWKLIDSSSLSVKNGDLGTVDITSLQDTTYTLRLVIHTKNKSTIERRTKFRVSNNINKLRFLSYKIAKAINKGIEEYYFSGVTNLDCDVKITAINRETKDTFYFSNKNYGGSNHFILLDKLNEGDYNFEIQGVTRYNETTKVSTFSNVLKYKIEKNSFKIMPYSFNRSYQLNGIADFGNGKPQFVVNDLSNLVIDKTLLYEFSDNKFKVVDSLNETFIPIDYADFNGDGKSDLLTSTMNETDIFLNNGNILRNLVYKSNPEFIEWGEGSYDVDGDGKNEVFCTNFNFYTMKKFINGKFETVDTIKTTEITQNVGFERGGLVDDFDGDGKAELVLATRLGTLHIYEYNGNNFVAKQDILDQISLSRQFMCKVNFPDGKKGFLSLNYGEKVIFNEIGSGRSIWTARLFKSDGDNSFNKVWSKEFVGVRDGIFGLNNFSYKNGVSAGNLDNEVGDEIVISTFPNVYVFKVIGDSLVGIYHNEFAFSNSTMVYDFDKNGVNEIAITTSNGTELYEYKFNEIGNVFVIDAYALGQSNGLIKWQHNNSFDGVEIYEINGGNLGNLVADVVGTDSLVVTGLKADTEYIYTAIPYKIDSNSKKFYGNALNSSDLISIKTHHLIGPTKINKAGSNYIIVQFDGELPLNEVQSQNFLLFDNVYNLIPSKALTNESNEVILVFSDTIPSSNYTLKIESFRDKFNSPTKIGEFDINIKNQVVEEIYLKRLELQGNHLIMLEFSEEVDLGANKPENYILKPYGYVFSVDTIPNESHKVQLNFNKNTKNAIGQNYTIQVVNVFSKTGKPITTGPGNTLGFTFAASVLENCFVYPSPISLNKDILATFSNLTSRADISIFNESGQLIRKLHERDGNGGVEWDLKNENGQIVKSGVYFYKVVGVNDEGNQFESHLFKFAVTP